MKKHLKFIDELPCLICGGRATHHHLLRVAPEYLTPTDETAGLAFPKIKSKGMGTKSDDRFCIPVCCGHHQRLHSAGNDKKALELQGFKDPEKIALYLYEHTGDLENCIKYLRGLKRV